MYYIIETGLDIPNMNTIIIENADTMGLAQLYQLKDEWTFKQTSICIS